MIRAMRTAASGMYAQKLNVDNITNNLANVNTTGFKKAKLEFQDVLYEVMRMAGATTAVGYAVPVELQIGIVENERRLAQPRHQPASHDFRLPGDRVP